mmetsp:Transcript_21124/g.18732  ORF Transcript_21124/g.18732 Transcript_21124/m.18732 type:complete len:117 (+) Transcript_21124:973-1323(+)
MVLFYNLSLIWTYWKHSSVIFYFRPYDCISRLASQSLFYFFIFILIQFAALIMFQNWLWIVHAVGRRQTINETKNSHKYRYIYKRVLDPSTKQYLYIHRSYGFMDLRVQLGYIYNF